MASRIEKINKILRSLQSGSPDVEAAALISEDGLVIASVLPQHLDALKVAGMSATMLSLGGRAAHELDRGELEQVIIKGNEGYVVLLNVGKGVLLMIITNKEAKLGLVFLDMRRAAEDLKILV